MKVVYLLLISIFVFSFSELVPPKNKRKLNKEIVELNKLSFELAKLSKELDNIDKKTNESLNKLEEVIDLKNKKLNDNNAATKY